MPCDAQSPPNGIPTADPDDDPQLPNRSTINDVGEASAQLITQTQSYLDARSRNEAPDASSCAAWELFYTVYFGLIEDLADRFHLKGVDVSECVQETWLEMMVHLRNFRYDPAKGPFRGWLAGVVRHIAADHRRGNRRRLDEERRFFASASTERSAPDPHSIHERATLREVVHEALAELLSTVSELSYRVFYERWIEGRSTAEIAVRTGLTGDQVLLRQHRVMKKFRAIVARRFGNPLDD
jgi:RNA polymerase sigma factor (sigma-70 family)